jgi:hypothetical protein
LYRAWDWRKKWMAAMITEAYKKDEKNPFVIGGDTLRIDLGNSDFTGVLSFL